jgi:Histidine kinase-like ATPase domain
MHRGHQAAPIRAHGDGGLSPAPEMAVIPPGLLPVSVAGPPGRAFRSAGIEPETPRAAREFTRDTLRRWDLGPVCPDAAVVVSELVTNALRYGLRVNGSPLSVARRPVDLTLWSRESYLICAVADPSPEPPVLRLPDSGSEAGRGLQVVQALTSCWGWTLRGGPHKVVWAALELPVACQTATGCLPGAQAASLSTGPGGKPGGKPAGCAATGRKPAAQPAGHTRQLAASAAVSGYGDRCPTRVGGRCQPRE